MRFWSLMILYHNCFVTISSSTSDTVAYHWWMKEHGGSIVNIIVDMWNGFPGMA